MSSITNGGLSDLWQHAAGGPTGLEQCEGRGHWVELVNIWHCRHSQWWVRRVIRKNMYQCYSIVACLESSCDGSGVPRMKANPHHEMQNEIYLWCCSYWLWLKPHKLKLVNIYQKAETSAASFLQPDEGCYFLKLLTLNVTYLVIKRKKKKTQKFPGAVIASNLSCMSSMKE